MSEDSVVRALFLDGHDEFIAVGKAPRVARLPEFSTMVFVYGAIALDFTLLAAITAVCGRGLLIGAHFTNEILPMSAALALCGLFLCNLCKLHRIEMIGDYRRFATAFQKVWLFGAILMISLNTALLPQIARAGRPMVLQSWLGLALWIGACWVGFMAARFALARGFKYCVAAGIVSHRVVVVGATGLAENFIERVKRDKLGVRVDAIFDEHDMSPRMVAGVPVRGNLDDLLKYHKRHEIDTVVIAMPLINSAWMRGLVQRLSLQPLRITMLPGPLALEHSRGWCAPAGTVPGIHLMQITDLPIERSGLLIKGLFDRLAAGLALLLFGPIMLLCAFGIKLSSPGPIFFRQKRIGYRNREFRVFKFRTMHVSHCNTGKLTERNDPRVFAFGQILRKLSFDELPQLLNVMLGDMSLVGPRPHMPEARAAGQLYFDVVAEYAARHRVKPGITGWAQVNGWRGPTETIEQIENRVMHDLHYIDNWSFGLDLKILVKTVFVGFFGKNAF